MNILLGICGSPAAIQTNDLVNELLRAGHEVSVVASPAAVKIAGPSSLFDDRVTYFDDDAEWYFFNMKGKAAHVEISDKNDVFIIAPCSANTIGKISNGLCDNLLTCCVRAWDFQKKMIVAPAMNARMWNQPITKEQIDRISAWGISIAYPKTAGGASWNEGDLADVSTIVSLIK
jgi:phosphopantothenoylcysteine decarboxylase